MPKITQEQKEECLRLYKKGFKSRYISKETGISFTNVKRVLYSFDAGDFSWMSSSFRHFEKLDKSL